jgi:hypothetical protein
MKSFKRKIALLLALLMVFAMVPANVFADDAEAAPRQIRSWVLGRVATPVRVPTGTGAQTPGENFVVSISLVNLRNAVALSPQSIMIPIELTGANADYLRFLYGQAGSGSPNMAGPLNAANAAQGWHNGLNHGLSLANGGLGTIRNVPVAAGNVVAPAGWGTSSDDWVATMVVNSHQRATIWLSMSGGALTNIPTDATGMLDLHLPFAVRTNTGADWMVAYLNNWGGNVVLSEGPLTAFGARGIDVLAPSTPVNFEWQANLNRVRVVEIASGALTQPLSLPTGAVMDPYGLHRVLDGANNAGWVTRVHRPYRSLAIRLTAPQHYHWGSQVRTSGNPARPVAIYSNVVNGAATDGNVYLYSPNNILQFGHPIVGDPTGGDANIAVYTYMTPAGRHEKLIIIQTVRRIDDPFLSQLLGEIHIGNLVLVPGENAPQTGNVYVDGRVGTVSTFRAHAQPRVEAGAVTQADAVAAGGVPANAWLYCYAGFQFIDNNHPVYGGSWAGPQASNWVSDWAFPETITYTQVTQATRRRIVTAGVHPWGHGQVVTGPAGDSLLHGQATGTDVHGLGLDWQRHPNDTYRRTILVAVRAEAGLVVSTQGDVPELRSGSIDSFTGMPPHTTGRTATVRVEELVPNALHLTLGRPVTFTMPEGVILTGVEWRVHATGATAPGWTRVVRPAVGVEQNINAMFTDSTFTIRHNLAQARTGTWRLEARFYVSVEAGFEHKFSDELEVTVGGSGATANLNPAENSTVAAYVYDPVVFAGGTPIAVDFVGREQNIDHSPIGQVTITETEGGMLEVGTNLWVYVASRYGIGWPLMISRGTTFTDAESGLGLMVTENRNFQIGLSNELGGGSIRAIQLTVVQGTREGYPGTITLDATTLFGHVYQGEVYYLVVTGNAIAENHNIVANGNYMGTFATLPYGLEIVRPAGVVNEGQRANSLRGVTFSPSVDFEGAPQMIWHRTDAMRHEAGFVGARAFATVAGVTPDNIVWASGTATIAGWDYQGNWVRVTLTQGSTEAQIVRGTAPGLSDLQVATVDIAAFAEGLSGPTGSVYPIFRHNRIYLPFRFLFNVFGYSADYTLTREGNVAVIR